MCVRWRCHLLSAWIYNTPLSKNSKKCLKNDRGIFLKSALLNAIRSYPLSVWKTGGQREGGKKRDKGEWQSWVKTTLYTFLFSVQRQRMQETFSWKKSFFAAAPHKTVSVLRKKRRTCTIIDMISKCTVSVKDVFSWPRQIHRMSYSFIISLKHQWKPKRNKTKVICANSKLEKNWGLGEVAWETVLRVWKRTRMSRLMTHRHVKLVL